MKHKLHFIQKFAVLLSTLFFAYSASGQNALNFDGIDDYIISPYNGITGNSSRTVEAWINPTLKSTQAVIADMGLSSTGQRFTFNLINGKLRIEVGGSGLTGTTVIPDGNWHHVAVTYDNSLSSGKFSLYIDGVQEGASFDLNTAVNTGSGDFRIGGRVDGTNFFQGAIDEVRVWNKAKSLAQIVADTGAEFCTSQFGLVAYHRFNQGTASGTNTNDTISIDDSGIGNNGRMYGFALTGSTSNWVNGKLNACIPPSCLNPNGLTATNTFGTTADIYWTQSNSGSTFKMEYGPSGFTLGTGTKSVPTNDTVFLTGLTPTTVYDVYVKEICSATDSSTWAMLSFNTGCGIINTFPYVESFDSAVWVSGTSGNNSGFAIDPCWTASPTPSLSNSYMWGTRTGSTSSSNTGPTTDYSGSGNYIYTEASYGATNSLATVQSPAIDLSSLTVPQLSFQFHMYGSTVGTLMAWAWNGSNYDTVWTISGDQGNAWNEGIVDLSAYSNSITHIVFAATKGGSYSDIAIDQVEVAEAPACPKPTMFNISNITPSSVDLNFISSGTKFQVEFGPTGFTQGTSTTTTILSTGHTISGLNPNTVYDFYIKNDCTDSSKGTSAWVGPITAQTLCRYTNYYHTDWDQLASGQTDYCWTFLSYGASTYATVYAHAPGSSTPQPVSGTKYYRMYKPTSTYTFLISPEITDLDQNTLQLRLQATHTVSSSSPVGFAIGTMSSLSDTASFIAMDTVITTQNTWTEFTVLLNNVPSGHRYVVLKATSTNYMYMGIDDLYIESIPACLPPSLGVFSQIKDTSVVMDWVPGAASTFDIEYGVTGFTQGSGITLTGITDTNQVITGLAAQSCYDFYIRGNCSSSNQSPWYGPISVCTECATMQAPYLEDFEDTTWVTGSFGANQISQCWTRTPTSTFSYRWESGTNGTITTGTGPASGANNSAKYVFTESNYGSNGADAILETPFINFSSLTAPALSFAYHMHGATMGNLYVLISNGSQYDTIHVINGEQQQSPTDAWKTAYVDLSAYNGSARTLQFLGDRGSSSTSDMAIDEVSVDEMPACLAPSTFNLDSVNATFADFSWNSLTNGTSFKMEYGPVGFTQGSSSVNTVYSSSSPTQVSGLTPNTTYDIYLTDMCDSTSWIGPITFTTLMNDDAQLQSLISPANRACGDSSYTVEVVVKNNGLNAISNLPVTANISGALTASISTIFSGPIAPGATATITVGNINTYAGGTINVEAYTALSGDQDLANDTLKTNAIEMISAQPILHPFNALCTNDSIGQFAAITQTGITYNWYQNQTDVTPFATGDTIDVLPNQTLFVDRSKEVDQLIVDAPHTSSQFGNMFKLYIKNDFTFTGFSFVPATSGTAEPIAFFKQGNFVGHETTRSSWTAIDSVIIPGAVANNWYRIDFTNPVQFTAGDTISFYLANKQGTKMRWQQLTTLNAVGDLYLNNADFEYYAGVTGAYFGTNMTSGTPRAVSSIMHYGSNDVCGNSRIAVTMGVNNDTAMASFTTTVNANGADVDFDASASKGHVYQWNYGDGNTGSGVNSSNTYASAGTYKVTLTVTDTVCNTTDTISQTILANVSMNEFGLNETIEVYPNPNKGNFNIDLNLNGGHDVRMVLVNTLGQIVYSKDLGYIGGHSKTNLNAEGLTPGIYYLRITAGSKSATIKVSVIN